jgi:hypothetical protein
MGRRNKGRRNRSPSSSEDENEDFGEAVIEVTGWVDGEKQTKRLEAPDRWKVTKEPLPLPLPLLHP